MTFQGSLLDIGTDIGPGPLGTTVRRRPLTQGAWVDVRRGWFGGADVLFDRLLTGVAWRAERRQMYERVVEVPRLLCFYDEDDRLPHPALDAAREALNAHYAAELGEPLRTAGLCLYRDGRDSTMVAILSIGTPRALALRPRGGGGPTVRYEVGHGDLLVMGGSCQRTWEHAVPKTARPTGPRISIQFRPRGVR